MKTQITAAPSTSESVTGAASSTCGTTFAPRFTNDVRSRVMNSFFIMQRVLDRHRPVEAEVVAHRLQRLLVGVAPGDARRRVDAGRGEEDQEDEHADREQHEHHRDQPRGDEAQHQALASVLRARVERVADAVAEHVQRKHGDAIAIPGASATAGRV